MTGLDYFFVQRELSALEGSFLNNVYDEGEAGGKFRLKFNNDRNVRIDVGRRIHFTRLLPPATETQSSFTKLLREKLDNARVASVRQIGTDRIVEFSFANGLKLVFESFAKGNAFLLDENGKILRVMTKDTSPRLLQSGKQYAAPEARKNFFEATEKDFDESNALEQITKKFGVSPFYAKEAIARASVAEKEKLSLEEKRKVAAALRSLCENASPRIYFENGAAAFFSPIELQSIEMESKLFESFSECLDEFFESSIAMPKEKVDEGEVKRKKIAVSLQQLQKAREELQKQIVEEKAKGDWLYLNYSAVEGALEAARKGSEKEANGQIKEIATARIVGKKLVVSVDDKVD